MSQQPVAEKNNGVVDPTPQESRESRVAQRAYELWEERGRKEGTAARNWFDAELEFDAERVSSDFK